MNQHFVQFYESDAFLVDEVTHFIGNGLKAGEAGIVIASKHHREALQPRLGAHLTRGQSLSAKWRASKRPRPAGPYIALDADETLSRFMVDGWPDEHRFREAIGGVIAKGALVGNGKVRAFGEMVALLWEAGQRDAAIRVEDLWNELAKRQSFSLFCAYPMRAFSSADDGKRLLAVCSAHSHVYPAETVTASMNPEQLNRVIVQLQHKAAALEAEVRKRAQLEKSLKSREAELSDFLENAVEGVHRVAADGTILYARSQGPGHGSEFVVHLPLPQPGTALAAVRAGRKAGAVLPQKILVVDDNADAAETLAECLRFLNHEVSTAHDATSAIEQALLESPDLVILDIGLPGMDGYEVARRLRTLPQMKSTVLVALTGYAQEGDIALAAQSGFDHHLSKPLDLPKLTALLETRRRPKRRSASSRFPHGNLH